MRFLLMACAFILAGVYAIGQAQGLESALGAVYSAQGTNDCYMVGALTDYEEHEVGCFYTFIPSSTVMSVVSKYGKVLGLDVSEQRDVYDVDFREVGTTLVGVRASDEIKGMYVILLAEVPMKEGNK